MTAPIAIINADLYTPDAILPKGLLLAAGGRILAVGESAAIPLPATTRLIDAEGGRLTPGLIDLAQFDFAPAPSSAAGVTAYLRACPLRQKQDLPALARAAQQLSTAGAQSLGLHLIGPWLRSSTPPPAWEDVWVAAHDRIRMLTLDPAACPDSELLAPARRAGVRILLLAAAAADVQPYLAAGPVAVRWQRGAEPLPAAAYALATVNDPPDQMAALWRHFGPDRVLLSGSSQRPLQAQDVRRFMAHTGASFSQALACATLHPAAWLGLPLGRLRPAAPAHLLCWSKYGAVAWARAFFDV